MSSQEADLPRVPRAATTRPTVHSLPPSPMLNNAFILGQAISPRWILARYRPGECDVTRGRRLFPQGSRRSLGHEVAVAATAAANHISCQIGCPGCDLPNCVWLGLIGSLLRIDVVRTDWPSSWRSTTQPQGECVPCPRHASCSALVAVSRRGVIEPAMNPLP